MILELVECTGALMIPMMFPLQLDLLILMITMSLHLKALFFLIKL